MSTPSSATISVKMNVDVDGAPNAYGPDDSKALDFEQNAHRQSDNVIVGYRTVGNDGRTPVIQGPGDPCPGFFVAETSYADGNNANKNDPRRYVNAAEINYTLHAKAAREAGVQLGDYCIVHSKGTRRTVFAIVGDSGNSKGEEGSLALLQRLGYPFKSGKSGTTPNEVVVRYFAGSNPGKRFFFTQAELDVAAQALDLDTDFSSEHPGDPGRLVLASAGHSEAITEAPRTEPFAPLPKAQSDAPPAYPGHMIVRDDDDKASVRLVQQRLSALGYTEPGKGGKLIALVADGGYGTNTQDAVELFQMRHTDLDGRSLRVDGRVGPATWGALFGRSTVPDSVTTGAPIPALAAKVLEVAASQVGVLEHPLGSNGGPEVDAYLRSVGLDSGNFWCMAFVYWCHRQAASALGVQNPAVKTGGVLFAWNRARENGTPTLTAAAAQNDPSKILPGMVFIMSTSGGSGHTGLVVAVRGNQLETIEGNTNEGGSSNGIGVFRRTSRHVGDINRGYIQYV